MPFSLYVSACFSLSDKHSCITYVRTYHSYEGTALLSATFGLALIPRIHHQAVDPSESSLRLLRIQSKTSHAVSP